MTYGKNQRALLDFLHKHPNQYHRIKRRKALDAAKGLMKKIDGLYLIKVTDMNNAVFVSLKMPRMLIEQNW